MSTDNRDARAAPFFSICIPQYNRTRFLLKACEALAEQSFRDFEICISDDCSTDGGEAKLIAYLEASGLPFALVRQSRNLRYDGNLRAAIALARGRYCFLHANDDSLADRSVLQRLHDVIAAHDHPAIVVTNFADWSTGAVTRRVSSTRLVGAGPAVAASNFRNVAFVSGIVVERARAHEISTAAWDGTEMYQMYLAAHIVASGGRLLNAAMTAVSKDIAIEGEAVDSYARRERAPRWPITEKTLPMARLGQVVEGSIREFVPPHDYGRTIEGVFLQLYKFTYPFWYFEYRRVQSWSYACGVFMGLRPGRVLGTVRLGALRRARLYCYYAAGGAAGLLSPLRLIEALLPLFYRVAKR